MEKCIDWLILKLSVQSKQCNNKHQQLKTFVTTVLL